MLHVTYATFVLVRKPARHSPEPNVVLGVFNVAPGGKRLLKYWKPPEMGNGEW